LYEIRVAPFIAKRLSFLLRPIYLLLKSQRVCFVVNIADGVGHITAELDNFLRMLHLGEIERNKRYILVKKPNEFSETCVELYGGKFWFAAADYLVYDFFLPITMRYREITIDPGISRLKWQLPRGERCFPPEPGQTYLYQVTKKKGLEQVTHYFARRTRCPNYFPLKVSKPKSVVISRLLKIKPEKIALVHIKTKAVNATAAPTDPLTYLEAIGYLKDLGYRLVFVGREIMPGIFKKYGIVDYAGSQFASFRNDILLFRLADLAIISGSGIAYLADCQDVPFLYLNSWHLNQPLFSGKCIIVPALIKNQADNYLTFTEQVELYKSLADIGAETFPAGEYFPRNAAPDEILAATRELLSLKRKFKPRSPLQERFRRIDPDGLLAHAESRVSDYFLEKHADLLP